MRGIPQLYEGGQRAEIIWTPEDIAAFRKVASRQVADIIDLACHTGLRRADLAAVTWDKVGEKATIILAQKKSRKKRRRAVIPITCELRAVLDRLRAGERAEGVNTVLVNGFGQPWSGDGLGQRFIAARNKADIRHEDGRLKHPMTAGARLPPT